MSPFEDDDIVIKMTFVVVFMVTIDRAILVKDVVTIYIFVLMDVVIKMTFCTGGAAARDWSISRSIQREPIKMHHFK